MSRAYVQYQNLVNTMRANTYNDLALGALLYNLKENDAWREAVGEGVNSWVDFLSQPEINITKYRADKLIRIYEFFIVSNKYSMEDIDGVPTYALDYVSKHNAPLEKINELLNDARNLSQKDFKEKYHDTVTDGLRTYTYMVMKKCNETGNMTKEHGIPSELIKQAFNLE